MKASEISTDAFLYIILTEQGLNMGIKKKYLLIATLIIICAVVVVIYAGYFTGENATEYDGTLVKTCQWRFL